jgi:hypothetical protein
LEVRISLKTKMFTKNTEKPIQKNVDVNETPLKKEEIPRFQQMERQVNNLLTGF